MGCGFAIELVGLAASSWHAHVFSKAGGQEQHQWFRPSILVLPVLAFQLASYFAGVRNRSAPQRSFLAAARRLLVNRLAVERRRGPSSK